MNPSHAIAHAPASTFNPWPYAITGVFIVFAAAMTSFVVFSTRHKIELVRADYYEQEILFQKQIDRVQRTQALSEPFVATIDTNSASISLRFPAAHTAAGIQGTLSLYRPANAALDQSFPVLPNSNGIQTIPISGLAAGLWRLRVQWTSDSLEYFHELSFQAPQPQVPIATLSPTTATPSPTRP